MGMLREKIKCLKVTVKENKMPVDGYELQGGSPSPTRAVCS